MEPPARDAWEAFSTLHFVISERILIGIVEERNQGGCGNETYDYRCALLLQGQDRSMMEPFHKVLSYDEEHHSRHSVSAGKSDDIGNDLHTIWLFFTCKDRQFYAFPPLPNVKNGGENSFSPPFSFAVPIFNPIFAIGYKMIVVYPTGRTSDAQHIMHGLFLLPIRNRIAAAFS